MNEYFEMSISMKQTNSLVIIINFIYRKQPKKLKILNKSGKVN